MRTVAYFVLLTLLAIPTSSHASEPSLAIGSLWAYNPSTKATPSLRLSLAPSWLLLVGERGFGIVIEPGASASFASFDLSPYMLLGASGPAGPIRIGGSVVHSYTPPWSEEGPGSHLLAGNVAIGIPIVKRRFSLLLSVGPRWPVASTSVLIGGGVIFIVSPGAPSS